MRGRVSFDQCQTGQVGRKGDIMKKLKPFPFESARRITSREVLQAHRLIEEKLGVKRTLRGRPPKEEGKYKPISIRLNPIVLEWAKKEARKQGVGYQTVINQILLKFAA